MSIPIQPRRNTAALAAVSNPVLLMGELGLETDTGMTKRGDGATAWSLLPYDAPNATVLSSTYALIGSGGSTIASVNTVTTSGAAQTIPDVTTATVDVLTLTSATCTLTFPTAAAGKTFTLILKQDATGGRLVSWPAGLKWPFDVVPVLATAANAVDELSFSSPGTTWRGSYDGSYSS